MRLAALSRPGLLRHLLEDLTPEQARHAGRLAAFIYKKLSQALNQLHGLRLPYKGRYLQTLRQTWVPNDGRFRFAVPPDLHYAGLPVIVAVTNNGQNPHVKVFQKPGQQQRYAVVLIDVKAIEDATTPREVGAAIREILYHVVHEAAHVHNYRGAPFVPTRSGAEGESPSQSKLSKARQAYQQALQQPQTDPARLALLRRRYEMQHYLYLTAPWEVEAYGRQFAMLYHRYYPFDDYDERKLLKAYNAWCQRNPGARSVNANLAAYFNTFRQPAYQNYTDANGQQPFKIATTYLDHIIRTEVRRLRDSR